MNLAGDIVAIDSGGSPSAAALSVAYLDAFVGVNHKLSARFGVESPPDTVLHAIVGADDGLTHVVELVGGGDFAKSPANEY